MGRREEGEEEGKGRREGREAGRRIERGFLEMRGVANLTESLTRPQVSALVHKKDAPKIMDVRVQ